MHFTRLFYLRSGRQYAMSADARQLELLMLTRHEDYQELSSKINLVSRQLNVKLDALSERFAELQQQIRFIANKLSMPAK